MHFIGFQNNSTLELEIVDYQFPESINWVDTHDANWCMLEVKLTQGQHVFNRTEPAIETWDISKLYKWFKALSEKQLPERATLGFLEPCITFNYLSYHAEEVLISVELACELKPPFKPYPEYEPGDPWEIVLRLSPVNFEQMLNKLEQAMMKFPVRSKQ